MVCRLFAANLERGRGRNYVTIFCFCILLPFGIVSELLFVLYKVCGPIGLTPLARDAGWD
jgi:hypothetical protein